MTQADFNKKYENFTEPGFKNPMQITTPEVIIFVDGLFQDLIKIPDFKVSQIKVKFDYARVYTSLGQAMNLLIEQGINEIFKKLEETK